MDTNKFSWFQLNNYAATKDFSEKDWLNEIYARIILSERFRLEDQDSHKYKLRDYGLIFDKGHTYPKEKILESIKKYGLLLNTKNLDNELNVFQDFFYGADSQYKFINELTLEEAESFVKSNNCISPGNKVSKLDSNTNKPILEKERDLNDCGTRYIVLNLHDSDENLTIGFKNWLLEQRKNFNLSLPKHESKELGKWSGYRILPIFDLLLISQIEGCGNITTDKFSSELIFHGFPDAKDLYTNTAKKKMKKVFSLENIDLLYNLANAKPNN